MKEPTLQDIRKAVASYIESEGCSCCEGSSHRQDRAKLCKLLGVTNKQPWTYYGSKRPPLSKVTKKKP